MVKKFLRIHHLQKKLESANILEKKNQKNIEASSEMRRRRNQNSAVLYIMQHGVKNRKSQALGANEIFGEVQSVSEENFSGRQAHMQHLLVARSFRCSLAQLAHHCCRAAIFTHWAINLNFRSMIQENLFQKC